MKYKISATSANLGVGFDAMGIALNLYNEYEVDLSPSWEFFGFEERYSNEDNLFVRSYKKALKTYNLKDDCLKVSIKTNIPISRGLGSSSSLIVGGIVACDLIHNLHLNKDEIFRLARDIEGHPDNVAPCIYGGLCIINKDKVLKVDVDDRWYFKLFIPEDIVSTEKARAILPSSYSKDVISNNVSASLMAIDALKNFNQDNISLIMSDLVHEPYRKTLISKYESMKEYALNVGFKAFIISGSGSSCLGISERYIDTTNLPSKLSSIKVLDITINKEGIIYE